MTTKTPSRSHRILFGGRCSASKFVGIYSGRPRPGSRREAQIGMVWSPFLVEEIIIGHMRDTD
jgi:hypothetical protein